MVGKIPKQKAHKKTRISPPNVDNLASRKNVVFSFELLKRNKFFNLDATCVNWSNDLFKMLLDVSKIAKKRIESGEFSSDGSPLRIHNHKDATPPCEIPYDLPLKEFFQIRISKSKGGIHGKFIDNVFYVIWLDPQHNMYPDENHGGLKEIKPPSTCCKERDKELSVLQDQNKELKESSEIWQKLAISYSEEKT